MDELTDDVCSALHRTLRTGRDTASASRGRGSQRSAPAHLVCAITLTRDRAQPASRARRPAPEPGGSRGPHSQHAYPPGGLGRAARGDPAQPRRPSPVASPALSPGGAAAPPPRCRRPSTPRPRSRCSRTRAHTARRTREEGGQQYGQCGSSYAPSAGPSASAHPPPARPLPCRARPHRPPLPRPTAFGRRSRPGTLGQSLVREKQGVSRRSQRRGRQCVGNTRAARPAPERAWGERRLVGPSAVSVRRAARQWPPEDASSRRRGTG